MSDDASSVAMGRLIVVSGLAAAGKTTVGRALAESLPRAVHIDGQAVHAFMVTGAEPYAEPRTSEGLEQMLLRYSGALAVSEVYRLAGYDAVITDNILGTFLGDFIDLAGAGLVYLVMLDPDAETISTRDELRGGPRASDPVTVEALREMLQTQTRRVGLWLDTSAMTVDETVVEVLARLDEALVDVAEG